MMYCMMDIALVEERAVVYVKSIVGSQTLLSDVWYGLVLMPSTT